MLLRQLSYVCEFHWYSHCHGRSRHEIQRDHYTTTTCHVVYGSSNACLPACLTIKRISNREEEVEEVEEVEVEEEQEGAGGLGRGGGG